MIKILTKLLNKFLVLGGIAFIFHLKGKQSQKNKQLKAKNEELEKQNEATIEIAKNRQYILEKAHNKYPQKAIWTTDEWGHRYISRWVQEDE